MTIRLYIDPSCYHFYSLVVNTTTLESWEKDRVAVMFKKGKTRQVCSVFALYVISLCLRLDQVSVRKCSPKQCNIQSD
jgi:hypothetical protein